MRKLYSICEAGQRSQPGIPWPHCLSCPWVLLLPIGVHPLDPIPSAVPSWLLLSFQFLGYLWVQLKNSASWSQLGPVHVVDVRWCCSPAWPRASRHRLLKWEALFHPEQITLIFIFWCSFQRGSLTVWWPGNSCFPALILMPSAHDSWKCMCRFDLRSLSTRHSQLSLAQIGQKHFFFLFRHLRKLTYLSNDWVLCLY